MKEAEYSFEEREKKINEYLERWKYHVNKGYSTNPSLKPFRRRRCAGCDKLIAGHRGGKYEFIPVYSIGSNGDYLCSEKCEKVYDERRKNIPFISRDDWAEIDSLE